MILALPATLWAQDLREQGVRLAHAAAIADAQQYQPCQEVDVGLCMKLPSSTWERAATWAIAGYGICAFADLSSTMHGIGKGVLVERNPLLKSFSDNSLAMAFSKGGMTAGVTWLLTRLRKTMPVLTTVGAASLGSFQCWAAGHNQRETNR